jgi:hypothetical protein
MARAGFDRIPAVQHQNLYELKSFLILQPGSAALTHGLAELEKIIRRWAGLLAEADEAGHYPHRNRNPTLSAKGLSR